MKRLIRFDWAIKKLLRDKVNFAILEGFISELIKEDVKIVKVLEGDGSKQSEEDKFNKVDLIVKDSHDRLILVEVLNEYELDYFQRILQGASRLITEYINEGGIYRNIKKVISVSIVYFNLGQGEDYVYYGSTSFEGIHKHDELKLTAKQQKVYMNDEISSLFPEYYLIKTERFKDILDDKLDEWVYFFKNGEIREKFNAKGIQIANNSLDIMKMGRDSQKEYKRYLENLRYKVSVVDSSYGKAVAKGKEIGLKKGEELGIKKGKEAGLKKGEELGRKKGETQKAIKIAVNMLKTGLEIGVICKLTGLNVNAVQKLNNEQ